MGSISMSRTALISIVVQSVLFGIFAIMFLYSQIILLQTERGHAYNRPLWVACVIMFVLALTHISVDCVRLMKAFLVERTRNPPNGTEMFLTDLSDPTFVLKSAVYEAQTLIGDACIIYRTCIVWGRRYWVVLFPSLLYIGSFVCGGKLLESFATSPGSSTIFVLTGWGVSWLITTLVTNVSCTGLIAGRIWYITTVRSSAGALNMNDGRGGNGRQRGRAGPAFTDDSLRHVMNIVVESGALYSAALVATVGAFMSQSWGHFVVLDSLSSIIGITFTLIIIRLRAVQRDRSAPASASSPLNTWRATPGPGRRRGAGAGAGGGGGGAGVRSGSFGTLGMHTGSGGSGEGDEVRYKDRGLTGDADVGVDVGVDGRGAMGFSLGEGEGYELPDARRARTGTWVRALGPITEGRTDARRGSEDSFVK